MGQRGWGGGIEIAACSHAYEVNVWIYEKRRAHHERNEPPASSRANRDALSAAHEPERP